MFHFIKILLVIFVAAFSSKVAAQDTIYMHEISADRYHWVWNKAGYFIDRTSQLEIANLLRQPFSPARDSAAFTRDFKQVNTNTWLRWILVNDIDKSRQLDFFFQRSFFVTFYTVTGGSIKLVKGPPPFYTPVTKNERKSFPVYVPAGSQVDVYVKAEGQALHLYRNYPVLAETAVWQKNVVEEIYTRRYYVFVDVLFLSIIFFITVHTLAQFFFNRRKEFLFYAFYAFAVLTYFTYKFDEYNYVDLSFSHFPYLHKYGNNLLSYVMYYGYYRFVRSFIDFKKIALWFYRVIRITEIILLTAIVTDLLTTYTDAWMVRSLTFNIIRCCLLAVGFTGVILLFRSRNKLAYFIAAGSGLLLIGGLASMILSWVLDGPYKGFDPIIYMQLGMVLELLFFTLGLSYKTSQIEKEKIRTQQLLIEQLEENKKLQDQLNNELEDLVKQQTEEITAKQEQLEKEKEQQLTLEFKKKLAEMELQVLKSQLNPHFYFNTLNNLYGLTMINPAKAPDAILKLSDIMEYVIYDCRSEKVPLEKELKFINSYFELEKLRYDDDKGIQLTIKGDSRNRYISPLLLIQFVENAFKHGIEMNKQDNFLKVDITIEDHKLFYSSVNRSAGKPYNENGVGLANVRRRLNMLYPGNHELKIGDHGADFFVELELKLS